MIEHLSFTRREVVSALTLAITTTSLTTDLAAQAAEEHEAEFATGYADKPLICGLLIFPNLTALDLVAPELVMSKLPNSVVHLIAESSEPVMSDSQLAIVPTMTFEQCPEELDEFFVPGGPKGILTALQNDGLLDFVSHRGSRARYITSVCTGSVLLGAAGLLEGYKAASYWGTLDILPVFERRPSTSVSSRIEIGLREAVLPRDSILVSNSHQSYVARSAHDCSN
ncbi:DJ-1/PfpI family protein [Sinorhizobium meliloti]|uniref:DJ-1/PfpI family protein n=1 Tax=Rhizobium meliloti TaxID=382 RepID=UPI0002861673|nr:DJ-1/PfpI family protein [Sinorhizobium meliloti]ASP80404.1 twin-arginine translocation pathway signal protein [Sinorhizobium meliloti]MQW15626.1 twin-arginine translocation pathway signal protein [Sinorhizobium meliloti]CCM69939.1 putative secreted protein [Sinorhizobium meliloti Rm41]